MTEKDDEKEPLIEKKNGAEEEFKDKALKSVLASCTYMILSITQVFLNKLVLSDPRYKGGSFFTSWYQFVVAYILLIIITSFFSNVPVLNRFPPLEFKLNIAIKVVPASVVFLLMIGLNNKCLEYVNVSGYQVVRSLTIFFNIILTYIVLKQKTSFKACLACFGVVCGFYLGIEGDIGLSFKGAVFGVLSSFFVAANSITVKKVIGVLDGDQNLLMEYNTPMAIILLLPVVYISGDFEKVLENNTPRFWAMQTLAGVVGFFINISTYLSIKYTSSLTHNLSGTLKACIQTLLSFYFFANNETISPKKMIGLVFTIGFSFIYFYIRQTEMRAEIANKESNGKLNPLIDQIASDATDEADVEKPKKREV